MSFHDNFRNDVAQLLEAPSESILIDNCHPKVTIAGSLPVSFSCAVIYHPAVTILHFTGDSLPMREGYPHSALYILRALEMTGRKHGFAEAEADLRNGGFPPFWSTQAYERRSSGIWVKDLRDPSSH